MNDIWVTKTSLKSNVGVHFHFYGWRSFGTKQLSAFECILLSRIPNPIPSSLLSALYVLLSHTQKYVSIQIHSYSNNFENWKTITFGANKNMFLKMPKSSMLTQPSVYALPTLPCWIYTVAYGSVRQQHSATAAAFTPSANAAGAATE